MRSSGGSHLLLGTTEWGAPVSIALEDIVRSSGMISGAPGSGKTGLALILLAGIIDQLPYNQHVGAAVFDGAKSDLFKGGLGLVALRLNYLEKHDPPAAARLRRLIRIINYSATDPLSEYDILKPWGDADAGYFSSSRADLLIDLLPGHDTISLSGHSLLQKSIAMLSELGLPVTILRDFLYDAATRSKILQRSHNHDLVAQLSWQFSQLPKSTLLALCRRIEALFASESIRLMLSGTEAPDFRALQDQGALVFVNCFGPNIPASLRRLLLCLSYSDFHPSVVRRLDRSKDFLAVIDEAHALLAVPRLREHLEDGLRIHRSFRTRYLLGTQHISASVNDPRLMKLLETNINWSMSFRGEPGDAEFLKPVLPVTGRKLEPQGDPFQPRRFYSLAEERAMALESIAHLPDRTGYLWLRSRSGVAIKMRTRDLEPSGQSLEEAGEEILRDPSIGGRLSRAEFLKKVERRDHDWRHTTNSNSDNKLADAFRRRRGGEHIA
jgi:hypothetical protein